MKKLLYISIFIFSKAFAQDSLTVKQYINQYKDIAIAEMQRSGVPAAITLAQGIFESSAGKSELVMRSNNHFGIKCRNTWTGRSVRHDDDARQECFRAYDSAIQSYIDHSDFLRSSQRYAFLFGYDATDYNAWAKGLKQAGYATNPRYAQALISTIEKYRLNDYTLLALNRQPLLNDVPLPAINTKAVSIEKPIAVIATENSKTLLTTADAGVAIDYPKGIFTINNCKVLYAQKGTSLLALAIAHKVSMPNLISWNDMDKTNILPQGQYVFLEKKQKKGSQHIHEVKPGETLWQISQNEGIRLSNLLQYNQLSSINIPAVGEKIYLQSYASKTPKLVKK